MGHHFPWLPPMVFLVSTRLLQVLHQKDLAGTHVLRPVPGGEKKQRDLSRAVSTKYDILGM